MTKLPQKHSPSVDLFTQLDVELWFARRLEEQGYHVFLGATNPDQRRERIRQAIIDRGCDCTIVGCRPGTGKPENYAEAFKRFYGEDLRRTHPRQGENP